MANICTTRTALAQAITETTRGCVYDTDRAEMRHGIRTLIDLYLGRLATQRSRRTSAGTDMDQQQNKRVDYGIVGC